MKAAMKSRKATASVSGIALRAVVFAGLWWGLTEGAADSWTIGIPAVIAATIASYRLRIDAHPHWNAWGVLRFVAFFFVESIRAGVDVARRALTLDIAPRIIEYPSVLGDPGARTLFCGTVSLLPGTLTTEMHDGVLYVHTLDARQPVVEELQHLEHRIAGMLGTEIVAPRSAEETP